VQIGGTDLATSLNRKARWRCFFVLRGMGGSDWWSSLHLWRSWSVITGEESDILPLYSVEMVNVLLKLWVSDNGTIFNNWSYQDR